MKFSENTSEKLRHFFLRNTLLKLISLIIAFLLWSFLMLEKKSEIALSLPVRVENVPENLVIIKPAPENLRVVVRGTRTQLSAMTGNLPPYRVDLSDVGPGVSTFNVVAQKVSLPRGVQVVHVSPAQFSILLDDVVQRTLPVNVHFRGTLPPDLQLRGYRVEPEEVTIAGARSELVDEQFLETEPINLSEVHGDTQIEASLLLDRFHIINITTHSAQVSIYVDEVQDTLTLTNIEVTPPEGFEIRGPSTVTARLSGPKRILRTLTPEGLTATAHPADDLTAAVIRGRVELQAPEGVEVDSIEPGTLELRPE